MQFAWRASLVALLATAPVKLGYDRERALDLQWLFTNARIAPAPREHVMDALFGFARRLGVDERDYRWDIPLPEGARTYALRHVPMACRPSSSVRARATCCATGTSPATPRSASTRCASSGSRC